MAQEPTGSRRIGASHAHLDPQLRSENPLYTRAASIRAVFGQRAGPEQEAAQERGSSMVRRSQPKPALRPSPSLARGVDRANFDQAWSKEQLAARPREAVQTVTRTRTVERIDENGNAKLIRREQFKTKRRAEIGETPFTSQEQELGFRDRAHTRRKSRTR